MLKLFGSDPVLRFEDEAIGTSALILPAWAIGGGHLGAQKHRRNRGQKEAADLAKSIRYVSGDVQGPNNSIELKLRQTEMKKSCFRSLGWARLGKLL